jgi:hypothetical protein
VNASHLRGCVVIGNASHLRGCVVILGYHVKIEGVGSILVAILLAVSAHPTTPISPAILVLVALVDNSRPTSITFYEGRTKELLLELRLHLRRNRRLRLKEIHRDCD